MPLRRSSIVFALVFALAALAGGARAELIQKGNLRVFFGGHLAPRALPREHPAPVTVSLSGSVATADGTRPPQLREMTVAVNRAGLVSVAGLPRCPAGLLQQTSSDAALERCRSALVGHGHFAANVNFPDAPLIPAQGQVLAFNSRIHGRPGLLLHLYGTSPVRAAFVLPFTIAKRNSGNYGTVFSTRIPELASDLGYVTDIEMTMGRRYAYKGKERSFLSASCSAPAGFSAAAFPLARGTFSFANGQRLTTSLARDCRVRG
ncbi:MAG: hypothetical protein ACRDLL_10570 [Solirubrobacterales bacterium]